MKFAVGKSVKINGSAQVAFDHIGKTAVVTHIEAMGTGIRTMHKPIQYGNIRKYTIRFDDGTTIENVPESELDSV